MTIKPVVASPELTIRDVAALMEKFDVGSVVLKRGHELVGIVTETDFVQRAILEGYDVRNTPVHRIMTKDLITVGPGTDIMDALLIMKDSDVRHLPVLDDGKFVGFVTVKDILRVQPQLFDTFADAYRLREEHRKPLGQEPVLDEEE
ncbi:TPA: CBS domain-containing protein [Candidatus Woesearchaeota archaeon]|nr:CBS domain-containing protein [Candidatus Woesearchaeota archaeon]